MDELKVTWPGDRIKRDHVKNLARQQKKRTERVNIREGSLTGLGGRRQGGSNVSGCRKGRARSRLDAEGRDYIKHTSKVLVTH